MNDEAMKMARAAWDNGGGELTKRLIFESTTMQKEKKMDDSAVIAAIVTVASYFATRSDAHRRAVCATMKNTIRILEK